MKITSYKTHVIYNVQTRKYVGELWVNNKLEQRTAYFLNEGLATSRLNKRIEAFNEMQGTKIPLYEKDASTNKFTATPKKLADSADGLSANPPELDAAPQIEKAKLTQARRKPFTPYGLKGYFVDKQGNIRLHLDRKANANTIVLHPDMFAMLADMVKATQEQQNDTQIS